MLELRNVSIDRYFRDVSLTVGAGEVVVLYGRVGSGIEELAGAVYWSPAFYQRRDVPLRHFSRRRPA